MDPIVTVLFLKVGGGDDSDSDGVLCVCFLFPPRPRVFPSRVWLDLTSNGAWDGHTHTHTHTVNQFDCMKSMETAMVGTRRDFVELDGTDE